MKFDIDVCYFLGSGSQADDWELRLSMRSWIYHLPRLRYFHVVGHLPAWLTTGNRVVHHPLPDVYRHNKDANLIAKTLHLAMCPQVSDPFILCSDDQFLLRDSDPEALSVPAHHGDIAKCPRNDKHDWFARLHRTAKVLRRRGYPTMHFDTHIPFVVPKSIVPNLLQFNWGEAGGYCVFSLLFNAARIEGRLISAERIRGALYGAELDAETIATKLSTNLFASIDADSLRSAALVKALEARFPHPSCFEAYPAISPLDNRLLHPPPPMDLTPYTMT